MQEFDEISNHSGNRHFADIVSARASRRAVLAGSLGAAAVGFVGAEAFAAPKPGTPAAAKHGTSKNAMGFTSIPLDDGTMPTIAPEYDYQVIIPWREKLDGSGESYPYEGFTAEEQEKSFGLGHDGMWFFAESDTSGVLCINHEYGTNTHLFGASAPTTLAQVRLSQATHGVAVAKIAKIGSSWKVQADPRNRRITVNTPVKFSGPAATSPLLTTTVDNDDPKGTVNNCSMGHTPWGTYLTCEENFHMYFGGAAPTAEQERYGITAAGGGYRWHEFDERFDLSENPNEENRFGWVLEIDPNAPEQRPVKRTAIGRYKHEGATVVVGRGQRVVVYSGDDERNEYIYKFVSSANYKSLFARGKHPLDEGTLYVAQFSEDGTGRWLELSPKNPALAGWTMDKILVHTRLAADAAGATKMDRPEWITEGQNNEMFCTLTNNTRPYATVRPGNPDGVNPDGHIIKWTDAEEHTGTTFEWDFFAIAKNVKDDAGQMFGSPDGIWADQKGRVFVQTDGGQPGGANDQMLVADQFTGQFNRLMTGVKGGEVTGVTVNPSQTTMFANIQHPGNGDPSVTNFPATDGVSVPRDATLVITRKDGGIIGS